MLAMAFLIAIIGAGTFTACSSDDDDDNTKNKTSIIGTWRQDWGDDKTRDYTAYSFFEDKTDYSSTKEMEQSVSVMNTTTIL